MRIGLLALVFAVVSSVAFAAVSVNVNGTAYSIPQNNEKGWGTAVTTWIQAISSYSLQPNSATFTLTSDLDFGASYGLKSLYYKTRSSNLASTGNFRLANTDSLVFRNAANSGDLVLTPNATDGVLNFNAVPLVGTTLTQTITNKTLSGNTATNLISGSGTLTLNTSGTVTVPNATDTLVGKATTDTLTNKTLNGNTATNLISGSGTLTLNTSGTATVPNATDTLVGKATTDTLTNKTLTSPILTTPAIGAATGSSLSVTGQLTSTVATGTAPLVVSSTTRVSNLNAATAGNSDTVTTNANLTGDVTSSGNAATVALVGGSTAANVHTSEALTAAASSTDTVGSTLVIRNAGSFSATQIKVDNISSIASTPLTLKATSGQHTTLNSAGVGQVRSDKPLNLIETALPGTGPTVSPGYGAIYAGDDGFPYYKNAAATVKKLGAMTTGGDLVYGGSGGTETRLANGSSGQALISGGGTAAPSWSTAVAGNLAATANNHGVLVSGSANTATVIAPDSDATKVLTSGGASADPTWQAVPSAPTEPFTIRNLGLATSISSGALTVSLKQSDGSTAPSTGSAAVAAAFRSSTATSGLYNLRSITSALTFTLTSGTTLGSIAQASTVWIYLIDSDGAGTMKIGASTIKYDEGTLQTSVAESVSVTATNASPCVFTSTAHGYQNNEVITLTGTPPTGFSTATNYYVVSRAANTFQLSATPGGTAINSSSTGTSVVAHVGGWRLVSDAVYTSMPVRVIGRLTTTIAAPGTWVAPSEVALAPSVLSAPETIFARYTTSSQTIGTSETNLTGSVRVKDSHGFVNGTTGTAIAPVAGTYQLCGELFGASTTATINTGVVYVIAGKAAVDDTPLVVFPFQTTSSVHPILNGCTQISAVAGDILSILVSRAAAVTSFALDGTNANWFSMQRIAN